MANRPEEFPQFTKLDDRTVASLLGKLNQYLHGFSANTGITGIAIYEETVLEIFERIEKRRIYLMLAATLIQ